MIHRFLAVAAVAACLWSPAARAQHPRGMTFDDVLVRVVSDPQLSPDDRTPLFTVSTGTTLTLCSAPVAEGVPHIEWWPADFARQSADLPRIAMQQLVTRGAHDRHQFVVLRDRYEIFEGALLDVQMPKGLASHPVGRLRRAAPDFAPARGAGRDKRPSVSSSWGCYPLPPVGPSKPVNRSEP